MNNYKMVVILKLLTLLYFFLNIQQKCFIFFYHLINKDIEKEKKNNKSLSFIFDK